MCCMDIGVTQAGGLDLDKNRDGKGSADAGGPLPTASPPLEEALRLRGIADQQVLRLLVVVQHHQMVFSTDARLLVPPERGVRRVVVVAVGPDPAGLDLPPGPVGLRSVPGPDAGPQAVQS